MVKEIVKHWDLETQIPKATHFPRMKEMLTRFLMQKVIRMRLEINWYWDLTMRWDSGLRLRLVIQMRKRMS